MATNKRVFTLRLNDEVFDKIGQLATQEHRSMTNYIEYVLLKHIEEIEKAKKKKEDYAADTKKLECQIDTLVYQLYGLTGNEIKLLTK